MTRSSRSVRATRVKRIMRNKMLPRRLLSVAGDSTTRSRIPLDAIG